jgi:peptidoglycan glycosyltransferase
MNGPIRQVAAVLFIALASLVVMVSWLQVIQAPDYRDDPRNARVVAARAGRERGTIITSDGVVVATSEADPGDPQVFRRVYPEGAEYAHVVGYSTALFGNTGIEASRSSVLVSDRDSTISGVLNAVLGGDLRPRGVRLSINHELQTAAREALADQKGAVIALDPTTGAVLVMVSNPTFDPNTLVGIDAAPVGDALVEDPDEPLLNRATQATYNPGSTFKVVTAAAALETGIAGPGTLFDDVVELDLPGSTATIRNFSRGPCADGGEVSLTTAFARSCNTIFGALGLELGAPPLVARAEAFGFNTEPATDFPAAASVIPDADTFENALAAVAQTAIGERDVRATPLQMATVAAAVANDGEVLEPYVVAEVFTADASIESRTEPRLLARAMSPATADAIAEMMERVVTAGTGSRAAVSGVRIAGKTGTAQVTGGAPHSWFIGFGPVDAEPGQPQIAIAVVVESGGAAGEDATGGTVAAPIAQAVLASFFGRTG